MVMNNYFQCALASIILVALRSLFLQFLDLPKIFKTSAYDGVSFCYVFFGAEDVGFLGRVYKQNLQFLHYNTWVRSFGV